MTLTRVSGGYALPRFEIHDVSVISVSDFAGSREKSQLREQYLRAMNDGAPFADGPPNNLDDAALVHFVSFDIMRHPDNDIVTAYRIDNAFWAKHTRATNPQGTTWLHVGPWPETRH